MASRGDRAASVDRQNVAVRITVGFIPKARDDLDELEERSGLSKTDIVNRSVSLMAFVTAQLAAGKELILRDPDTGEAERLHLL